MYSLGKGTGLAITFSILGLLFDAVKNYSPMLILSLLDKNKATAILLSIISLSLVFLSTTASIFSLQNGVDSVLSQSRTAQVAKQKISSLQSEIENLETLRTRQLNVDHITQASTTSQLIAKKRAALSKAMDTSVNIKSDSLLASYSTLIVLTISIALEVLSLAMTLCLHHLSAKKYSKQGVALEQTPKVSQNMEVGESSILVEEAKSEAPLGDGMNRAYSVLVNPRVVEDMQLALIQGRCLPTHRSIYNCFRNTIRQKEVKTYLMELAARNIIRSTGKGGYVLSS